MYSICTRYSSMWWLGEGRLHRFGVTLSWVAIINFWHIKLWYKQNCVLSNKKNKRIPFRTESPCWENEGQGTRAAATDLGDWPTYLIIFFLQDEDYITGLDARCLVSLSSKSYFLPVLHAFVHVYLQNLHLLHHFLALAFFTAVFFTDNFAWSGSEKHGEGSMQTTTSQPPTEESVDCLHHWAPYLLRYNQYTQTASVGPSLGPAVLSWCAYHAPYMLYIFVQRPSCLPACKHKHTQSVRPLGDANMIN